MHSYVRRTMLLAALCAASPSASPLQAQRVGAEHNVTLVQLDRVPAGKTAMVFRRTSGADRDVIALSPTADQRDLNMALHVLDAMYAKFGDQPDRPVAAAVASSSTPATPKTLSARGKLHAAFIQELHQARTRNVSGFGTVKAFDIRVPNKNVK